MAVAILGGTLSAAVLAKRLTQLGHKVHVFRNVNDPKRAINSVHVFCEYQTATVIVKPDDPQDFHDEVQSWCDQGLLVDASNFRSCTMNAGGEVKRKVLSSGCRRLRPVGGFFALVDELMQRLPESVKVEEHQITRVSKEGETWTLHGRDKRLYGPYVSVVLAFDALPRASRKASQKQLLEQALPLSANIIASAAYAQMSSSMAVCLHFDPPLDVPFDTIVFEDNPTLKFASRNPKDDQAHRGLREKYDTWTLVATPEWSFKERPSAGCVSDPKANKGWDKRKVGDAMVRAFGESLGQNLKRAKLVVPTFHWEGCSYISRVLDGPPCAFDGSAGLGWCGDQFGGSGPAGATASAAAMSNLVHEYHQGQRSSSLPQKGQWGLRQSSPEDEDTLSITGPQTGRKEPRDGLDYTWIVATDIASGVHVQSADSYKKFRRNGPQGDNRPEGPWAGRCCSAMSLACETIEHGLMKITGLPQEVQDKLLKSAFCAGASGVCGGLWDAKTKNIDMGHGHHWLGKCPQQVALAEMGLHGHHVLEWDSVGSDTYEVFEAIKTAVRDKKILQSFEPDCMRVAFENMRGRSIKKGQTLCGWSWDNDRADDYDDSPKILIILGKSKISRGFKYAKEDRASLDVPLSPGDILLMYGDARRWASAVNGYDQIADADSPFDFVHMWLLDHRRLKQRRPAVYKSIHCPNVPQPGGTEYKWMQFGYIVGTQCDASGFSHVELQDSGCSEEVSMLADKENKRSFTDGNQNRAMRRRWQSKKGSIDYDDNSLRA